MHALRDHDDESGTTAVVAVLRGDQLYCANAGDSRATICRNGEGKNVTKDHKPNDPEEEARVKAAGGSVVWDRVVAEDGKNMLACARSIGDSKYKVRALLARTNHGQTQSGRVSAHGCRWVHQEATGLKDLSASRRRSSS